MPARPEAATQASFEKLSQKGAARKAGLGKADGAARYRTRQADEAPGRWLGVGQANSGECHRDLRLGDDHNLVGALRSCPAWPNAQLLGKSRLYGLWASLRNRSRSCLSGAAHLL